MPKVVIVDEDDRVIGCAERSEVKEKRLIVRVAGVLVFTDDETVVLSVVSKNKDDAGTYNWTAAGHVDEGETYEEAAVREAREEIGVNIALGDVLMKGPRFRKDGTKKGFVKVFAVRYTGKLFPDPKEIERTEIWAVKDAVKLARDRPEKFKPALSEYLQNLG